MEGVAREILEYMNRLLSRNAYLGIFGENGQPIYIDEELKEHYKFISSFIKENFNLLGVGDHSIPLSGLNLAFYKVSKHAMVILHTKKGPVGSLLAFKSKMYQYADQIESQAMKVLETMKKKKPKPRRRKAVSAERIPVLTVSIEKKKFAMDEASVLHMIDGNKTITEICDKTKIPRLKVNEILKKYQKKGWVKLKRIIGRKEPKPTKKPKKLVKKVEKPKKVVKPKPKPKPKVKQKVATPKIKKVSSPEPKKAPVPFTPKGSKPSEVAKPKPAMPIKAVPEKEAIPEFHPREEELSDMEIIYTFPILTHDEPKVKMSKIEEKILKKCDGRNTLEDICDIFSINKIELMSHLKKFQKKGVLKLTRVLPGSMKETKKTILEKEQVPIDESDEELVGKLDELIEKVEQKIDLKSEESSVEIPSTEIIPEQPAKTDVPEKPEEIIPEDSIITEEEFEETLSDLENLLETTGKSSDSSEIRSFDDALTELTGLLDDSSVKKDTTEQISLEESISEPNDNKSVSKSLTQSQSVPKIKGAKVICPQCQAALPSTKKICSQCGKPVKICPHCSAPISIHTRICPECSGIVPK